MLVCCRRHLSDGWCRYDFHLTLKWISSRKCYQYQIDPILHQHVSPGSRCGWSRCWGHTHRYVVGVDIVRTFIIVHRDQLHPAEVVWRESRQKLKQSASHRSLEGENLTQNQTWRRLWQFPLRTKQNNHMLIMFLNTEHHPWCFAVSDSQGRMLVYLFLGLLTGRSAASWERSRPTLFSSWKTPTSVKHLQDSQRLFIQRGVLNMAAVMLTLTANAAP